MSYGGAYGLRRTLSVVCRGRNRVFLYMSLRFSMYVGKLIRIIYEFDAAQRPLRSTVLYGGLLHGRQGYSCS